MENTRFHRSFRTAAALCVGVLVVVGQPFEAAAVPTLIAATEGEFTDPPEVPFLSVPFPPFPPPTTFTENGATFTYSLNAFGIADVGGGDLNLNLPVVNAPAPSNPPLDQPEFNISLDAGVSAFGFETQITNSATAVESVEVLSGGGSVATFTGPTSMTDGSFFGLKTDDGTTFDEIKIIFSFDTGLSLDDFRFQSLEGGSGVLPTDIPEPGSALLLALAMAGLALTRQPRRR